MKSVRLLPLLVPIALVAASCGQKAGVAGTESARRAVAPAPETTAPAGIDAPGVTSVPGADTPPRRTRSHPPRGRSCPVTATPTA